VLIDGRHFDDDITELPRVGTTENLVHPEPDGGRPSYSHSPRRVSAGKQAGHREGSFQGLLESLNGADLPLNHAPVRANVEIAVDTGDGTGVRDFLFDQETGLLPNRYRPRQLSPAGKTSHRPAVHDHATHDSPGAAVGEGSGPVPGKKHFPFDPTTGPGYVWHCHILDHEDKT